MSSPTTTRELRNAAADLLERDGWTRDTYESMFTGCRCLVGALIAARELAAENALDKWIRGEEDPLVMEAARELAVELDLDPESSRMSAVINWNDDQDDSGPVISALRGQS